MAYWIETGSTAKLAIASRPRGGDWLETETAALRRDGIDILVSLLTPAEKVELGLSCEGDSCTAAGVEFRQFPIVDRQTPKDTQAFGKFCKSSSTKNRTAKALRPIAGQESEDHHF